jgi:signal recognition particle subunit SEC65
LTASRFGPATSTARAPDSAWIEAAAKKLGLDPQREEKVRSPHEPGDVSGRVLVAQKGSKEATLQKVAAHMRATQDAQAR